MTSNLHLVNTIYSFHPDREIGNDLLLVEGLTKTIDGEKVLNNISFRMSKDDKIALVGSNDLAKTTLFKILTGELEADSGSFKWGITTSQSYFPKDNAEFFEAVTSILLTGYANSHLKTTANHSYGAS